MNDLQVHLARRRIVNPARDMYGEGSAEVESAKRVVERTLRVISSPSRRELPTALVKELEPAARIYLQIDGEADDFYRFLYPRHRPLPTWFVLAKCLFRR